LIGAVDGQTQADLWGLDATGNVHLHDERNQAGALTQRARKAGP